MNKQCVESGLMKIEERKECLNPQQAYVQWTKETDSGDE